MWFISCLFRLVPLGLLTSLWIIQTSWFWSWVSEGLAPGLVIEKANKGLVPFSLCISRCEHPLGKAEDIELTLDWVHFFATFSWRLSHCHIGSLTLNPGLTSSESSPFPWLYNLFQHICTWDVTWSDNTHTNHSVRDEKGQCMLHYHNNVYAAQVQSKADHVLMTHELYTSSIQAKLTENDVSLTVPDTPWCAQITPHAWTLTDGATLNAQGTWGAGRTQGALSHPWVGTIQGAYDGEAWHVNPFTMHEGIINITSEAMTITNIRSHNCVLSARLSLREENTPWKIDAKTPHGDARLEGHIKNGHIFFAGNGLSGVNIRGSIEPMWSDVWLSTIQCECNIQTSMAQIAPDLGNNHVIQGDLAGHLKVQGTLKNPQVEGIIELQNGLYHNIECGVWLSPIHARLRSNGSTWIVEELTAKDRSSRGQEASRGGIQGSGKITWSLDKIFSPIFDIKLHLDEVDIAHGDRFQGDASGVFHIVGSEPRVEGEVVLHHASVHLDAMSDAESIVVRRDDAPDETTSIESHFLPLNFVLIAPGPIMIDGLGFESVWEGRMMVQGHITKPHLVGDITCQKGHMNVLGIPMKIKDSRITYMENDLNVPQLNITAVHEVDPKQKIFFHVTGSSERPTAKFTSNMGLNERDIVSRLLFGQSADNISVWQSLQLANILANINNRKNQMSWMEQMRNAFGIDSFEVKRVETDKGNTAQTPSIGKRLGGLRVSVDAATSGTPGKAMVETNIHPNVSMNADVGGDRSSGVGVDWVYHY